VQIAVEWLRQGSSLLWLRAEYFLSFAAENRKLYCGGCMKVAKAWCFGGNLFSILALMIFLLKFLSESAFKSIFSALAPRSGFGTTISHAAARSSRMFCNSTRPLQIAVEWRRQSMHNTMIFCS